MSQLSFIRLIVRKNVFSCLLSVGGKSADLTNNRQSSVEAKVNYHIIHLEALNL